jgi:hypothetical protein
LSGGLRRCGDPVAKVDIPYYVVVKGRGYWRPKANMAALGFQRVSCGPDGPIAWATAADWNARWQRVRQGVEQPPLAVAGQKLDPEAMESALIYPQGSIGAGFREYRQTHEWRKKKPRTREDWWRAWKQIKPVFGTARPAAIDMGLMSEFRRNIERGISLREAHRVIKIWRAMWKVLAALKYCRKDEDPSLGVTNTAAKGRTQTWQEREVVLLFKRAWRTDRRGLAAALATLWDSQLSPGDVPALTRAQVARSGTGALFFTERGKTDVAVSGALGRRATAALDWYLRRLGFDLHDDAPLFWTAGSAPGPNGGRRYLPQPYDRELFAKHFAILRAEVFGSSEKRQLLDFRRSGAVEAIMGGATREDLGTAMGNGIANNDELFRTYVPTNAAMLTGFQKKRQAGRQKLRENESEAKVPTRRLGQSQLESGAAAKALK